MGKNYSKQRLYRNRDGPEGDCIVVNAHFNPIAVSEYEEHVSISKPSSELSFQMNGSKDGVKGNFINDKYPLEVVLPPEGCEAKLSCSSEAKEPALHQDQSTEETEEKSHLSLEEFECDVSVKTEAGMEKQEFLFTLYDLDGHGKITKDDIAGLVRSIYDAVGSSVKLPHCGSKTIKVRLTVSPDKKMAGKLGSSNSSPDGNNGKTSVFTPADITGSPHDDDKKNNPMSVYRQNLIHMIKTSVLEKKQTRGHSGCESGFGCKEFTAVKHHRHRHANNRDNIIESRDRRNHYLDLAGIENYNCKLTEALSLNQNHILNCPYQLDGTHICSKSTKAQVNLRTHKPGHHRSRSHDLGAESIMFRYHLLDKEQNQHLGFVDIFPDKYKWNNHSRSKSYDLYDNMCSPKLRPHLRKAVANGHSSSPHHHKHRNREREHQRAMQQVASWIEREPLGGSGKGNDSGGGGDDKKDGDKQFPKKSPAVVERHEHHHVHEHFHHHYHHYNEM